MPNCADRRHAHTSHGTKLPAFLPCLLALALVQSAELSAQEVDDEPAEPGTAKYILPHIPARDLRWTRVRRPGFTLQMGFGLLADYTAFFQDSTSESQVGRQRDQWELRAARAVARGTLGRSRSAYYFVVAEYRGLDREPEDKSFGFIDFQLAVPVARGLLAMGKLKEPWIYEMTGDAINLLTTERILNPFFVSRNFGLRWQRRFTPWLAASAGLFNDAWMSGQSLSQSGTQLSGRVTFLPIHDGRANRYLHLAISGRHDGADGDSLRFKGRPESNVSTPFVDTGNLPAGHANELGLELLAVSGGFTVTAEQARAYVQSPQTGNPVLKGTYVAASWFPRTVRRPYDPRVSFARRPVSRSADGDFEFVGRLSRLDLDDAGASGGTMTTWYGGVNWWVGTSWRVSAGYVLSKLDRAGTRGTEQAIHTRVQWLL